MGTAGLVMAEIRHRHRAREFLRQQCDQRRDVGLLHDLRGLRARAADHHVDRHGAVGIGREVERFERVETGELFVKAARGIEPGDDAGEGIAPVGEFVVVKRQPGAQRRGPVGPAGAQQFHRLQPAGDVPPRHHVGEGVVVHVLVVFVGTDDVPDVPLAVRLGHRARGPEPGSIEQDFRAGVEQERDVRGGAPVLPHGVGNVGTDVLLQLAAEHVHQLAVRPDHALGRRLHSGVGGFPGVERTPAADMRRLGTRAGQRVEAVHQQRPRRLRPDSGVERQQIGLGVPEDMAEIGISGQAARADGDPRVLGIGGTGKVVDGETQVLLQVVIALDADVAGDPAGVPGGFVLREHRAPAQQAAALQRGAGGRGGIVLGPVGPRHRDNAIEFRHLPGPGTPVPNPAQRERTLGNDGSAVEPKRGGAGHRDALAGAFRAPGAEVRVRPHRFHA